MSFGKAPRFRPLAFSGPGPGSYSPQYGFGTPKRGEPARKRTKRLPTLPLAALRGCYGPALLAKGGVALVFRAQWQGKAAVAKLVRKDRRHLLATLEEDRESLKKEAEVLHHLQNRQGGCNAIVEVLGKICDQDAIEGVLLECLGDSLTTRSQSPDFSTEELRCALLASCRAIHFMHKCLVAHNDVKPSNICKSQAPHSSPYKLIDLDAATQLKHREEMTDKKPGTLHYFSPEALHNSYSPLANDCYAVGQTFAEMGINMAKDNRETLEGSTDVAELARILISINCLIRPAESRGRLQDPACLKQVLQPAVVDDPLCFLKVFLPHIEKQLEAKLRTSADPLLLLLG